MSDYVVSDSSLTSVADAIRIKGGTSAPLAFPSGFVAAIGSIPTGGGGGELLNAIIGRTASEIYSSEVTEIGNYAFCSYAGLTNVDFPACAYIGSAAFSGCKSLASVDFPTCTYIERDAFSGCTSLANVNFPVCTEIGLAAFSSCTSLSSVDFPVCSIIRGYAFRGCTSLADVNFPVCTSIIGSAFAGCSSLSSVDFPACTSIGSLTFQSCVTLISVYLRASSLCTLGNSNAFQSTPIAGYTSKTGGVYGSVFVPASLYSTYISATNWTYYASRIASIPEV